MKYLDINKEIWIDEEYRIVYFSNDSTKNFEVKDTQMWTLFKLLIHNEGEWIKTAKLEQQIVGSVVQQASDSPIKNLVSKLKKELNNKGIPCNLGQNNDITRIIIENEKETSIPGTGRTGAYRIVLPNKKCSYEKIISDLYWEKYDEIAAQKDGEKRWDNVTRKLLTVYQEPHILSEVKGSHWNITQDNNIIIEAPNGYGKSSLLKSILLAVLFPYNTLLSDEEKKKSIRLRRFHGIEDDYFVIFVECKNLIINETNKEIDWIYESLIQSIGIDRGVDRATYFTLLEKYNKLHKLLIIIDGFDEIGTETRELLLDCLFRMQRNQLYGINARYILTTRPLFWHKAFNGFKKWKINKIQRDKDAAWVNNYICGYLSGVNNTDQSKLLEHINNYYVSQLLCTPAIITLVVREFQFDNEICIAVEDIIREMMLRFNYDELNTYLAQYERVYEEIAYHFLEVSSDSLQLQYRKVEVFSMIRYSIEEILKESNRRFQRVFNEERKAEESLGELFFTNVALLEYSSGGIQFVSPVFAYHLGAKKIIREFKKTQEIDQYSTILNKMHYKHRYNVMVVASSMVMHLSDMRFFDSEFGFEEPDEIRFILRDLFKEYLFRRWKDVSCSADEREEIKTAITHIMLNDYGDNVYTNRNMNQDSENLWSFAVND